MEAIAHQVFDKFYSDFHQILQSARHTGSDTRCDIAEKSQKQETHCNGPAQSVHMDSHEPHIGGFLRGAGEGPCGLAHHAAIKSLVASFKLAIGQILEVVLYILYWGISHSALVQSSPWFRPYQPAQCATCQDHHSKSE